MIPSDDRGLLLGDGLFETLLWRDGALANAGAHWRRLAEGCAALGLPAPDAATLDRAAAEAVARASLTGLRAAVRLTWTAGSGGRGLDRPEASRPRLLARAWTAPAAGGPVSLATVSVRRNEGSPVSRFKTLAYLDSVLARREARERGADEALMLNNRGEVACAAAANLFWVDGDRLRTPPLASGALAGTIRARVLAAAEALGVTVDLRVASMEEVSAADGLFLTNSLIGLAPVTRLDGQPVRGHALTRDLANFPGVTN